MNKDYIVKTEKVKDLTVHVVVDEDPCNPREWDNLGIMTCSHRNYMLGDEQIKNVEDFIKFIKNLKGIALPLYLYDHSGISMSTSAFSCQWDSGQVGFIYITDEKIKKEYNVKRISKQLREKVKQYLINEVETYDKYLTGQVYGYIVEETGDSCYGFYDENDALQEGISSAEWHIKNEIKKHSDLVKTWIKNKVPLIYRTACPF